MNTLKPVKDLEPFDSEVAEQQQKRLILKKIIAKESTNFNFKLGIAIIMLIALILSSVLRGSGKEPSVIGVTKCSGGDIAILVLLIVLGMCMSFTGAVLVQKNNALKKKVGYVFTDGDLDMNAKTCIKIAIVALLGGFFNAGFGISSTFILNPYLI